jgi:hypothetical protein
MVIIKSKPEGVSSEEHARTICEQYKAQQNDGKLKVLRQINGTICITGITIRHAQWLWRDTDPGVLKMARMPFNTLPMPPTQAMRLEEELRAVRQRSALGTMTDIPSVGDSVCPQHPGLCATA